MHHPTTCHCSFDVEMSESGDDAEAPTADTADAEGADAADAAGESAATVSTTMSSLMLIGCAISHILLAF